MITRKEALLLLAIIASGAFLRLYGLDMLPPGDGHDVAQYGIDALQILDGARPIFLESNFGREPMFSYLVALIYKLITGPGTFGIHLASALIGILTIPAVFLASRALFAETDEGKRVRSYLPLLASFLAAVSYWHLNWSRVGLRVILVPLFAALIVWALFSGFNEAKVRRSRSWFVLAGALLGLSFYTYQAARLLPALVVVAFALHGWRRRLWTQNETLALIAVATAAVLVSLPLGFYAWEHPGALSVRIRQATVVDASLPFSQQLQNITTQALTALSTYVFSGDTDPQFTIPGRPSLNPFLSIGLFAGILVSMWRFRHSPYLFMLAWLAIMTAPAMVADQAATAKRYLGAFPAAMILVAVGLLLPLEWLWERTRNNSYQTVGDHRPLTADLRRPQAFLYSLLLIIGLIYSTVRTYRDYFIVWAADPDLPAHFQVDYRVIGQAIRSLDPLQPVWLAPYPDDHPVIQLHAQPRPDSRAMKPTIRNYNGRFCLPYADPVSRGLSYIIVPGLQDASLAELQRLFPDGQTTSGTMRPGSDRPYYNLFSVRSGASPAYGPGIPLSAAWNEGMELLGYDVDQDTVAPGETLAVTLTYRTAAAPLANYTAFVHLLGPPRADGSPVWAQSDSEPCGGGLPTSRWQAGDIIRDNISLPIPVDAPAGLYELTTGFYTWPELTRLPVEDGDTVSLGKIKVIVR